MQETQEDTEDLSLALQLLQRVEKSLKEKDVETVRRLIAETEPLVETAEELAMIAGWIWIALGDRERALPVFERAVGLASDAQTISMLVGIPLEMQDVELAQTTLFNTYQRIVDPTDMTVLIGIVEVFKNHLELSGEQVESIYTYAESLAQTAMDYTILACGIGEHNPERTQIWLQEAMNRTDTFAGRVALALVVDECASNKEWSQELRKTLTQ